MEETQLLPFLAWIGIFLWSHQTQAQPPYRPATEAEMQAAKHMIQGFKSQTPVSQSEGTKELYVFVSFGLPPAILKDLMSEAKRTKAVLVLRGLKDQSFPATLQAFQALGWTQEADGLLIDPPLFERYGITEVPSYVLDGNSTCHEGMDCPRVFDKMAGAVTIGFALKAWSQTGDRAGDARALLEEAGYD
jgi:type-F conjugative transfer system pilin assembly protein TrbC